MTDERERIESSIRRALSLLEDLSRLPEDLWDLTAYKKALLCRTEIQYSIAVMRLRTNDPPRPIGRSKIDAPTAVEVLRSSLKAPPSEINLRDLQMVDLYLGGIILAMRRRLRAKQNRT
ncbi:MAG: hypothetical protein QXX77_03460 [Candidatus Methanosuratincola sp.]